MYEILLSLLIIYLITLLLFDWKIDINKKSGDVLLWWTHPLTIERKWVVLFENYI